MLIFRYNATERMVSLVKFFKNPDISSLDWNYRMPGRGTIVRNAKSLHQRLFIGEDPSSSSFDNPSSDPAPADRINIAAQLQDFLHQQFTNSPAESIDTFSQEVQLFAVGREQTTSIAAMKRSSSDQPTNFR